MPSEFMLKRLASHNVKGPNRNHAVPDPENAGFGFRSSLPIRSDCLSWLRPYFATAKRSFFLSISEVLP